MICVGIEDHIGIGVEAVVIANLPHQSAVGVGLSETEKNQQGDDGSQLRDHGVVVDLPVAPWPA